MIHSRRKSIPLNRIEWLIKDYKSWLESCTDLITLGEKLAMSSWAIFPFVFWLRVAIKWLSYKNLSKQVRESSRKKGTEKVPEVLTDRDVNKHNMPIAAFPILDWNSTAMAHTWAKHLRLSRTTIFSSAVPQPLCRLTRNDLDCDILQPQIETDPKSSLQQIFLKWRKVFQILE